MPARKTPAKASSKTAKGSVKLSKAPAKPKGSVKLSKVPAKSKGSVKLRKGPAKASTKTPSEEAIRRRAYEIFLERGGAPGDPQQDWETAAKELGAPRRKIAAK